MNLPTIPLKHVIAGDQLGEPEIERVNPASVADIVSLRPEAGPELAGDAVSAASEAFADWAAMPAPDRGAILTRAAEILGTRVDEVARDLTREEGKTLAEAGGEVRRAVDILRFHGSTGWRLGGQTFSTRDPRSLVYTRRDPVGVVVAITPWNFPIAIPAWKLAPALVAGNTVVLKPASLTGLSARHLYDALAEAGLPPGVLNVVYGSGRTLGKALVEDDRIAAITFTGSVEVGNEIRSTVGPRPTRIQLEMGGKNPLVVLDDADPAQAAAIAAAGGFGLTGQACTATSRLIVTGGVNRAVVDQLVSLAARYRPGDGLEPEVSMGPVVSRSQLGTDLDFISTAVDEGARVITGGRADDQLMLEPTVLDGVEPQHRIAVEEVFGPVISVIEADDFDHAIDLANGVEYGLSAGICTTSLSRAHEFAGRVAAGVVKVNRPTTGLDLNVPFGGIKASSTGTYREQGEQAVDFFTSTKSVYVGFD